MNRYLDWAAVLLYGHRPQGVADAVFAQTVQIVFTGILGILFAYLVLLISSRYHLLQGALYGLSVFILIYGATLLFQLHAVVPLELPSVAVDFAGAGIFGLVLAHTLHMLDQKADVKH